MNQNYTGNACYEGNPVFYRFPPPNTPVQNSNEDVTIRVNPAHNPFASANTTIKNSDGNGTTEVNQGHNPSASANTTMKKSDQNVTIDVNHGNNPFTSANSTVKNSDKDVTIKINHDYYRFAYNIVEKVLEIRKELNPNVPHNLPEPANYLFTKEHENMLRSYLKRKTPYLLQTITKLTNGVYDWENYEKCRKVFVEKCQELDYSENSFIGGCASVAFLAAHFIQKNYHCGALDSAVKYIASWIEFTLENGTIDKSCW